MLCLCSVAFDFDTGELSKQKAEVVISFFGERNLSIYIVAAGLSSILSARKACVMKSIISFCVGSVACLLCDASRY